MRAPLPSEASGSQSVPSDVFQRKSWSTVSAQENSKPQLELAGNRLECVVGSEKEISSHHFRLRVFVASIIQSGKFEWATALLILANTVLSGVDQSQRLAGRSSLTLRVCENLFLCVFTMEIILRLFAFGVGCFRSPWIVFDFVLISTSVFASWIMPFFWANLSEIGGLFIVMRSVRLLRLARTLRLLIRFKELWMLVRCLLSSTSTIMYTLLLLSVVIYMFASLGLQLITNNPKADPTDGDPEFVWIVGENFADLQGTMLTLIQFATLDSVASIYVPLIRKEPYLVVYFAGLIIVLGVVLMNLITAVVVNSALDQAMQDSEMASLDFKKKKARCIRDIGEIFRRMDTNGSGTITREELDAYMSEANDENSMLLQLVSIEQPGEIFDALDVSGDNEVSIDEFCDVLWTAFNHQGSIEIKRTEKKIDQLRVMLEESLAQWERMRAGATEYGYQEAVAAVARDPAEGSPASAETEGCCEISKVSRSSSPMVSTGAPPRPARDNAHVTSEPSWQGAEVPPPLWASCMKQTLINELQVTRQMLVQEVHHACEGVSERTAPETSDECPVGEGVHRGVPPDHHHRVAAMRTKRFAGALPRGRPPQASLSLRAERPVRPGCFLGDEAPQEPSVWSSCPSPSLPGPTTHSDVHREPN